MNISFPQSAMNYIARHKGKVGPAEMRAQVERSRRQFESMKPIVDLYEPAALLDIGCGLGLGTVMIAQYIKPHYLGLMDGDGTGELFADYREGAPAWNDVSVAGDLARSNLYSGVRVETFVQDPAATIPVDMIVSFKSWGTHYPVREYIDLAVRSLPIGGVIVIDLRPNDDIFRAAQRAVFANHGFKQVERFRRDADQRRHVFERVS